MAKKKQAASAVVSTEDIKQSVADMIARPLGDMARDDLEAAPGKDPKDEEQWAFELDFTDRRGKKWQGYFTNKILNLGEQQLVTNTKARFCGGMPLESIDSGMLALNEAIAHMTFSLIDTPTWAEDLRQLTDAAVVLALWEKVRSHETRYFRLDETAGTRESA